LVGSTKWFVTFRNPTKLLKEVFTHHRHKLFMRDVTDELKTFPESSVVFLWGDGVVRHRGEGDYES
jgi:hypothetical protein